MADLRAHGVEPAGRRVLVLGAGGSARAIVYGLAQAGATRITVANRSAERAAALLADLRPFLGNAQLDSRCPARWRAKRSWRRRPHRELHVARA